jgi:ADP-ribosylglycohydrolase
MALAAAAATAAAVSAAVEGWPSHEIFGFAAAAANQAESQRSGSTKFVESMRHIHRALSRLSELRPEELSTGFFPSNPYTIVPLAIVIATLLDSAHAAILLATNTGGDSDSVASIAGAILGARCPDTVNADWCDVVERVNALDLGSLAHDLSGVRH